MEYLLDNFDDIDGPGNNSYLYYNPATGVFAVVPWDHNLALGGFSGGGGPGLAPPENFNGGGNVPGLPQPTEDNGAHR
jgi:spore coat protein CotH